MNFKHGMTKSRPYKIWCEMRNRCTKEDHPDYPRYGGTGITVCAEWQDFNTFWNDMQSTYETTLTLDRIDNSKGYSKSNCRWATKKEQANNRGSNRVFEYKGESLNLKQLSEKYNISYHCLFERVNKLHWDIDKAIETPKQIQNRKGDM